MTDMEEHPTPAVHLTEGGDSDDDEAFGEFGGFGDEESGDVDAVTSASEQEQQPSPILVGPTTEPGTTMVPPLSTEDGDEDNDRILSDLPALIQGGDSEGSAFGVGLGDVAGTQRQQPEPAFLHPTSAGDGNIAIAEAASPSIIPEDDEEEMGSASFGERGMGMGGGAEATAATSEMPPSVDGLRGYAFGGVDDADPVKGKAGKKAVDVPHEDAGNHASEVYGSAELHDMNGIESVGTDVSYGIEISLDAIDCAPASMLPGEESINANPDINEPRSSCDDEDGLGSLSGGCEDFADADPAPEPSEIVPPSNSKVQQLQELEGDGDDEDLFGGFGELAIVAPAADIRGSACEPLPAIEAPEEEENKTDENGDEDESDESGGQTAELSKVDERHGKHNEDGATFGGFGACDETTTVDDNADVIVEGGMKADDEAVVDVDEVKDVDVLPSVEPPNQSIDGDDDDNDNDDDDSDDGDFGDFGAFNEIPAASGTSKGEDQDANFTKDLDEIDQEEDFGGFGAFNETPTSPPEKLHASASMLDAEKTKQPRQEEGEDNVDENDFGDFGDFDTASSLPIQEQPNSATPSIDPLVEKARAVFKGVFGMFAQDKPAFKGDDGGTHVPPTTLESILDSILSKANETVSTPAVAKKMLASILSDTKGTGRPPALILNSDQPRQYAHYSMPSGGKLLSEGNSSREKSAQKGNDYVPEVLSINLPTNGEASPIERSKPKVDPNISQSISPPMEALQEDTSAVRAGKGADDATIRQTLAQIPDLSFMLKSELSLPDK